jgi:uncharacterized protein DUF6879
VPSWEAFAAGDWDRALELNEHERDTVRAKVAEGQSLGVESRRLRVLEHPATPYLQWEMQYFRLLAEAGEDLRVIDASRVRHLEADRLLPEIVILGDRVLFEVLYDADGTAYGARRIDDPQVIAETGKKAADLYTAAEQLLDFFAREIAPVPAPSLLTREVLYAARRGGVEQGLTDRDPAAHYGRRARRKEPAGQAPHCLQHRRA